MGVAGVEGDVVLILIIDIQVSIYVTDIAKAATKGIPKASKTNYIKLYIFINTKIRESHLVSRKKG